MIYLNVSRSVRPWSRGKRIRVLLTPKGPTRPSFSTLAPLGVNRHLCIGRLSSTRFSELKHHIFEILLPLASFITFNERSILIVIPLGSSSSVAGFNNVLCVKQAVAASSSNLPSLLSFLQRRRFEALKV